MFPVRLVAEWTGSETQNGILWPLDQGCVGEESGDSLIVTLLWVSLPTASPLPPHLCVCVCLHIHVVGEAEDNITYLPYLLSTLYFGTRALRTCRSDWQDWLASESRGSCVCLPRTGITATRTTLSTWALRIDSQSSCLYVGALSQLNAIPLKSTP